MYMRYDKNTQGTDYCVGVKVECFQVFNKVR